MTSHSDNRQEITPQRNLEREVAGLIVEVLQLEIDPRDIQPDTLLFTDGLGLDSIDALELAVEISNKYGFELKSDDGRNDHFASLASLASYVGTHRTR